MNDGRTEGRWVGGQSVKSVQEILHACGGGGHFCDLRVNLSKAAGFWPHMGLRALSRLYGAAITGKQKLCPAYATNISEKRRPTNGQVDCA